MNPFYAALSAFAGFLLVITMLSIIGYELGYQHPEMYQNEFKEHR